VESLLGLRREGEKLRIAPCLPDSWPGFKLRYRYGDTVYRIVVLRTGNPGLTMDGVEQSERAMRLVDDQREHSVEVRI